MMLTVKIAFFHQKANVYNDVQKIKRTLRLSLVGWTYLHDDINIGGAVHTVVHSDEVRVMEGCQLPEDLDLLYQDLRGFLYSLLCDHFNSYRLGRILRKKNDVSIPLWLLNT